MADVKHKLTNIIQNEHGIGGVCTCGRWGHTAKSRRALKKYHDQHKRESK